MEKRVFVVIVILVTIIYGIVGAFMFTDIQLLQAPEPTIALDIVEINPDEAIIHATLSIANPNSFKITAQNLEVVIKSENGDDIARMMIEGGSIPPQEHRTFTSAAHVAFRGNNLYVLTSKITGEFGMQLLNIVTKTIPFSITVVTSMNNVLETLTAPVIHMTAEFGEITQERINFTGTIDAYNPNTFVLSVDNISVDVITDTGEHVGNFDIRGGLIGARSTQQFFGEGSVLLRALNAKVLTLTMSGAAGVGIAGVNKSLSFTTDADIKIPDIHVLLSPYLPTEVNINGDFKATTHGLIDTITFEVKNPNNFTLALTDIDMIMYRVDDSKQQIIATTNLGNCTILANATTAITGQLAIPYSKILFKEGKILPHALFVTVRVNATIQGLNQSVWIGVGGSQDLRPLK